MTTLSNSYFQFIERCIKYSQKNTCDLDFWLKAIGRNEAYGVALDSECDNGITKRITAVLLQRLEYEITGMGWILEGWATSLETLKTKEVQAKAVCPLGAFMRASQRSGAPVSEIVSKFECDLTSILLDEGLGLHRFSQSLYTGPRSKVWRVPMGDGRFYVMKQYDSSYDGSLLERELTLQSKCVHSNIVRLLGGDSNAQVLATEDCNQGSWRTAWHASPEKYGSAEAIEEAFWQINEALTYMKQYGIFHRDVKLDNIFCHEMEDGRRVFKLGDFGLAAEGYEVLMDPYLAVKTLAPECYLKGAMYTPACDRYVLGCLLFQLCTGEEVIDDKAFAEMTEVDAEGKQVIKTLSEEEIKTYFPSSVELYERLQCAGVNESFSDNICALLSMDPEGREGVSRSELII